MKQFLADLLQSPASGLPYALHRSVGDDERLETSGGEVVPIVDGIARFVQDESFVESFGFQWNQFDVKQTDEDRKTFVAKTGVSLEELKGKTALDAGCGGGRYCLVAAEAGASVVGADRSRAVEKARTLCAGLTADFIQADLSHLPFRPASFDLVFSIGVLHHSPDPAAAFRSIATMVKPGGRLSVWVYRRNTWPQESVNRLARWAAGRLSRERLLQACRAAAILGGTPIVNRTLNKIVPFSTHPRYENRVCDTFDWYSPRYQYHHAPRQIVGWFRDAGFVEIRELPPEKTGKLYLGMVHAGLLPGSGVNVTGRAPAGGVDLGKMRARQ